MDYRRLNNVTIKNRYPLPLPAEIVDRLRDVKYFTKMDLKGAYNLIRIKEGEEWKTAFRTRYGLYEYCVMPFGLCNAPASFQGLINNVLREHLDQFVTAYLDDILVYSKTLEEHRRHVTAVLEKLAQARLQVKLEKTEFHKESVEFLGSIVSREGLRMDQSKVRSILEWPRPRNVKEVQSFLGFANYYRRWIPRYSHVAGPLTELTKKTETFRWMHQEETAFHELKQRFTKDTLLVIFDPDREVVVETDASDYAIGACISQRTNEGTLRPVAFHSRKMSSQELNYDIHDKELLAIVLAFEQWRVYLAGSTKRITVFTDHKNLAYFITTKTLNRRQVR